MATVVAYWQTHTVVLGRLTAQ